MKSLLITKRRRVIAREARRYQSATKAQKGEVLNRLTKALGYKRNTLSWLLTCYGRKAIREGKRLSFSPVLGRPRIYDESFIKALRRLWVKMDFPCGQRMAVHRKEALSKLESNGEITTDSQTREKLLKVSPTMIDSLLAPAKKKRNRNHKRKVKSVA